ncbi:L-threonylcarbamoyladenylate synthase [Enhydrobacter sp.]|jgi:L-threonylcarbamoyladenylate synthase|uniref:L-threonylcarbamoyladenylate synthase n=1 Tax=Enhydrobacter sp. TaxID=1894999 RepID=UPI00261DE214|nr:L-threonylcarbamoyladenylate synthase [Enhydrobacter sp.]WIM09660.1 MAG: Threonylcarbamoyl-AMP synthase [Enhydrobacter sp.]
MKIVAPTASSIEDAVRLLRKGGLVAFPTETVYGLGGDATNERAVVAIFEAKGRPRFNPLIAHVPGAADAQRFVRWSAAAERLAAAFWPGPLTFVLPRAERSPIALLATAGLDTVAIRAPAHPVAQALIRAAGLPLAAPSANRSGAVSPTRAEHVAESLGERVSLILDGGPCAVGVESTVLDLTGATPVLLRPGGATREAIEAVIGPIALSTALPMGDAARSSPGQLESHYAPSRPVRLEATTVSADEALLAFGPHPPAGAVMTRNLSPTGDLAEAAANLFAHMRALDRPEVGRIAVMPVPHTGLGLAINDRLRRAAADDGAKRQG